MATDDDVLTDNRRASTRVPMSGMPVTIEHDGKRLDGRGDDFNEDCLAVLMADPPPVGATVTVRCVDDTDKEVVFEANVLRHRGEPENGLQAIVVQEVKA